MSSAHRESREDRRYAVLIGILVAILVVLLLATNPDEDKIRRAIAKELGPAGPLVDTVGTLGTFFGVLEIKYHDYLVCSTLTVKPKDGEEEFLAFGMAGQVFTQNRVQRLGEMIKKK